MVGAAEGEVKLGALEINAIESTRHNLIIKSSVDVVAVFTDLGGNKEHYIGEMGIKLGIDASYKTDEILQYVIHRCSANRLSCICRQVWVGSADRGAIFSKAQMRSVIMIIFETRTKIVFQESPPGLRRL